MISQIRGTDRVYIYKYIPGQRLPEHDRWQYDWYTGMRMLYFYAAARVKIFLSREFYIRKEIDLRRR